MIYSHKRVLSKSNKFALAHFCTFHDHFNPLKLYSASWKCILDSLSWEIFSCTLKKMFGGARFMFKSKESVLDWNPVGLVYSVNHFFCVLHFLHWQKVCASFVSLYLWSCCLHVSVKAVMELDDIHIAYLFLIYLICNTVSNQSVIWLLIQDHETSFIS